MNTIYNISKIAMQKVRDMHSNQFVLPTEEILTGTYNQRMYTYLATQLRDLP